MFAQAGKTNLQVVAEAYGENCVHADGSVASFSVMETDLKFVLNVDDLADSTDLADQAHEILRIVAGIPQEQFPGPNPGYIGISFQDANGDQQNYWFPKQTGVAAFQTGLEGEALLQVLQP